MTVTTTNTTSQYSMKSEDNTEDTLNLKIFMKASNLSFDMLANDCIFEHLQQFIYLHIFLTD
jgi:hypothetical protein